MSDLRLVKANIALFNGTAAEARRLLEDYLRDVPDACQDAQVLWLDAQTQPTRAERLSRLRDLLAHAPAEDRYARLAAQMLHEDARFATPPPLRGLLGVPYWRVALGMLALTLTIGALFALPLLFENGQPAEDGTTATAAPTAAPTLPDRSLRLPDGAYLASYAQGILQIVAYESGSARVIRRESGALVQPVRGARFLALEAIFECRSGICDVPPQGELRLLLDNGAALSLREDLGISGGDVLQPIAQGFSTRGWLVFEVPNAARVLALEIVPQTLGTPAAPVRLTLDLP